MNSLLVYNVTVLLTASEAVVKEVNKQPWMLDCEIVVKFVCVQHKVNNNVLLHKTHTASGGIDRVWRTGTIQQSSRRFYRASGQRQRGDARY